MRFGIIQGSIYAKGILSYKRNHVNRKMKQKSNHLSHSPSKPQKTMAEVTLFGFWASPFTRRVELALKLKGISYEYIEEDLSNKSPSVLKYNPIHKKVPILVHKEKPLAESVVILEYLDETWKSNPILPQDPYERATARFWGKFIDEMLLPTATRANRSTGKEQEQAKEEVHQQLKILEDELKGKEFFSGQRIGYLDIVANVLFWFEYAEEVTVGKVLTPEKFPIIYEWIQKLKKVDVVNECRVQKEKYQDFIKSISVVKP